MKELKTILAWGLAWLTIASCSVISQEVRKESEPPIAYKTLLAETDQHVGKTVILGGYISDKSYSEGRMRITILQAPLTFSDKPKSRDLSEGRFIAILKGSSDSGKYENDLEVTVAGTLTGLAKKTTEGCPYPCPVIETREIYIWPEYDHGGANYEADRWNESLPSNWYY